ncbi:MAG: DNA topoisomerase, partial [Limisphaerales bacterium]
WRKPTGDDADVELRPERLWDEAQARAIADAVRGQPARVTEESKPATQACGLLYDLTTLQREANARYGFSAKTTLALAQALYEKHKVLTYPRTDARALPSDYLGPVRATMRTLADSDLQHLAPHARKALDNDWVRPTKRVFDDAKVSDHFAIIPTGQLPKGLSDAEQKLYDLVVRRFIAVFFPAAQF